MAADAPDTPDDGEVDWPTVRVVQFYLGDRRYAIPVTAIDSIVEMKELTRIPRAPEPVDGVVDLRGEITAVVDPRAYFEVGSATVPEKRQRILVFDRMPDDQQVGMRVDAVDGVVSVRERDIDTAADVSDLRAEALQREFVAGVIREQTENSFEPIVLVDARAVVEATSE